MQTHPTESDWRDAAACRDAVTNPADDPFFAPDCQESAMAAAAREFAALEVCEGCPVRAECLAYAVSTRQANGVWGGAPQAQIQALIAQAARGPDAARQWGRAVERRGWKQGVPRPNARKTHCPQGHPYAGDNLRTYGNRRVCRTCQNERARAYQAARRAS